MLGLGNSHRQFGYLSSSQRQPAPPDELVRGWAEVQQALTVVGFAAAQSADMTAVLASVLHLGNVQYQDSGAMPSTSF